MSHFIILYYFKGVIELSLTHLELRNLEKYRIAIDLYWRSIESEDTKGYDDSVEYGKEKYGLTAQNVRKYQRATKFLYYDLGTCMLSNKYKITQLIELNALWLQTAKDLHERGEISHDLTCMELRAIAQKYKKIQDQNKHTNL